MEKPDFKALASEFYYENHNEDTDAILVIAMEHIWSSHVEPLQKENETLAEKCEIIRKKFSETFEIATERTAERDKARIDLQNTVENYHILSEEFKKLTAERDKLKSENEFMKDLLKKNQDQLWMNDDHWKTLGIILHGGN